MKNISRYWKGAESHHIYSKAKTIFERNKIHELSENLSYFNVQSQIQIGKMNRKNSQAEKNWSDNSKKN